MMIVAEKSRKVGIHTLNEMLTKATQEGKAAAADLCSARLTSLVAHAVANELGAKEILELIRVESEVLNSQGGAAWQ